MSKEGRELLYPLTDQNIEPATAGLLKYLIIEEERALQTGEFVPESVNKWEELSEWFMGSELLQQTYLQAWGYVFESHSDEDIKEFRNYLAGSIYQLIVYAFLAKRQPQGQTLLSPDRTLALFQHLFPATPTISYLFGMDSLKGVPVPDGIRVEENENIRQITTIFEFTLTKNQSYFRRKVEAFSYGREKFSQLLGNSRLVFVMPQSKYIPRTVREKEARILMMPFTHKEFGIFLNEIYERYHPEANDNRASLAEIQRFMRSFVGEEK